MGKNHSAAGPGFWLLLLLLLAGEASTTTTTTTTAEPQYLVMVPFLIHAGTSERICIHLSHLNETVTLSATLEHGAQNRSLIEDVMSEKDFFQCIPFTVPKCNASSQMILRVVVKGPTHTFTSQKMVLVKNLDSLAFVQTDKPIYNPGQKVLFRIISLSEDFLPLNEKFPLVYIQDPERNRLIQWHDVQLQNGLTRLSFPLSSEPILGVYKVVAQKDAGNNVEHTFSVGEYVLPRFEVSVKVPKVITIQTPEMKVTACGRYTHGKPVPGLVKVEVCRNFQESHSGASRTTKDICKEFRGKADVHGCLSQVVKTNLFQLERAGYEMNITVTAKVTEEGTGVELLREASTEITAVASKIVFQKVDTYYKPGIPFFGQVKLVDVNNAPMANETIQISVAYGRAFVSCTTDDQGIGRFSIRTDSFKDEVFSIHTRDKDEDIYNYWTARREGAFHKVHLFYSPSRSYLHIESVAETLSCEHTQPVRIHYILKLGAVPEKKIHFYYLVMAKGGIVKSGIHVEPAEHAIAKGAFHLDLSVDVHTAPLARVLVYVILPSGELVAHSAGFAVENCFSNKVKLAFAATEGLPGSSTHLHLAASKDSLCAIRAVDKSVLLMKPEADLSPQTVYNLLPVKDLRGYSYQNDHLNEPVLEKCVTPKSIIVDGIQYTPVRSQGKGDPYELLKNAGLKVFTNVRIHRPKSCTSEVENSIRGFEEDASIALPVEAPERSPSEPPSPVLSVAEMEQLVRNFSPETWLWLETSVDSNPKIQKVPVIPRSSGQADVPVTIPDTITEWSVGAFCTSAEAGFGLSETISLKAFQPFFVDLTLPYSVVQGEAFVLKATAFTYLQHCIRMVISLAPSTDFAASLLGDEEDSYCLCADERQIVSWTLTPKSLGEVNITVTARSVDSEQPCGNKVVKTLSEGQMNTVTKALLVEPEGMEKEVVFSSLVCGDGEKKAIPLSLKVPENVVEGSARADFCVMGDILGSAIQNLQHLLRLPYGCGEQNMVLFAPNIYILDYLNETEQLTEEIRSKAIGYLVSGYQQQLKYTHRDGSYSAFRYGLYGTGDTWLTAFVLKSFGQARRYIFIEDKLIQDAQSSLAIQQKENGCFQSSGKLLHSAMKGGVDDEVTMSVYITIALLEIPLPVSHTMVHNALLCLETAAQAKDIYVYSRALLAYAFGLAGKEEKRKEMLTSLEEDAVREEDGSIHWQRPGRQQEEVSRGSHQPRAPSAEVEMTSYVLLAYLTERPVPSQETLTKASNIVKWLSKQQNPTGGFSSTQDTMVALQALSLYGVYTYSKSGAAAEVKLLSGNDVQHQFQVDSTNRLVLQCGPVTRVPGEYNTEVAGEGCVHVQTTLRYNVHPHHEGAPFKLEVHTVPALCEGPKAHRVFDVAISVSYIGKRPASNMAIIDVKMLSGFIPVKSSMRKVRFAYLEPFRTPTGHDAFLIQNHKKIRRAEVSTNHILLYLEQVSNVTQSYSFTVEQEVPVQDLKPALVTVYDYYETDEFAVAEYSAPCSTGEMKQKSK